MKISILAKAFAALGLVGGASVMLSGMSSLNHAIAGMLIAYGAITAIAHVVEDTRTSSAGLARAMGNFLSSAFVYGLGLAVAYAMGYLPDSVLTAPIVIGAPDAGVWFVPGTGTALLYMMATQSLLEGFEEVSRRDGTKRASEPADAIARPVTSATGIALKGTALAAVFAATLNLPALAATLGLPAATMAAGGVLQMIAWPLAAIATYIAIAIGVRAPLLDADALLARVDARFKTNIRGSEHAPFALAMTAMLGLAVIASLVGALRADPSVADAAQRIQIAWALGVATIAALFGAEARSRRDAAAPAAA